LGIGRGGHDGAEDGKSGEKGGNLHFIEDNEKFLGHKMSREYGNGLSLV
jgi:hypothetical protein